MDLVGYNASISACEKNQARTRTHGMDGLKGGGNRGSTQNGCSLAIRLGPKTGYPQIREDVDLNYELGVRVCASDVCRV